MTRFSQLSEDRSFSQLLEVVRESALDAYANQDVPFERLVTELVTTRDQSRPPLFDVLFVLQNAERGDLAYDLVGVTFGKAAFIDRG